MCLKQSPLRRFCEDGFLGFRAKTAIPGLIEATPAKRGVGADRRLSLSGKPVLKPELIPSRSYAHSPSACSPMARSDAHRWQIVLPHMLELLAWCTGLAAAFALGGQSVAGTDVLEHSPIRGFALQFCVVYFRMSSPV